MSNDKTKLTKKGKDDKMTNNKVENYIESENERTQGHVDTRQKNFECENPDEYLGCDLGIDVAGWFEF